MAMRPEQYLARLRTLCAKLEDTGETQSWGHPNFTAAGRMFASVGTYQDRPALGIATSLEEQAFLVEDDRFSIAPFVGKHGWVTAWLDQGPEWTLLEELLRKAHARVLAKGKKRPAAGRAKTKTAPPKTAARRRPRA